MVRRDRFLAAGGFRPEFGDAYLHDLALRLAAEPIAVRHIPRVLYHGRSEAPDALQRRTSSQAIEEAVARNEGVAGRAIQGGAPGFFIVQRARSERMHMTAVICSRSPKLLGACLRSLGRTAGSQLARVIVVAHEQGAPNQALRDVATANGADLLPFGGVFNFAAMNNAAAELVQTPAMLFLNDDVTCTVAGWCELLAGYLSHARVGIAGATLWYTSGELQQAGIVTGIGDGVGHAGRHMRGSEVWPWLLAAREVSAVTGACLAIRTDLFRELGGFDSGFANNYNDVDLCFRVRERGLDVVCVPVSGLIHAECQTRPGLVRFEERHRFFSKWWHVLSRPDPYYSESLAPTEFIQLNLTHSPGFRNLLAMEP